MYKEKVRFGSNEQKKREILPFVAPWNTPSRPKRGTSGSTAGLANCSVKPQRNAQRYRCTVPAFDGAIDILHHAPFGSDRDPSGYCDRTGNSQPGVCVVTNVMNRELRLNLNRVLPRRLVLRTFQNCCDYLRLAVPALSCVFVVWGAGNSAARPETIPSPSTPLAVGTSTHLLRATTILLAYFPDVVVTRVREPAISISALRSIAATHKVQLPKDLSDTAAFLLSSPVCRNFLDISDGQGGVDGFITRTGLEQALETISRDHYESALLHAAAGNAGRGSVIRNPGYAAVLRDPGVPLDIRSYVR
jgi:hypothetical protein